MEPTLVRDIRKIEEFGYLSPRGEEPIVDEPGVEFIKTPITNWSEFLGKVEDVIPEEIKIEYGLKETLALNRRLNEFSKEYLKENNISVEESGKSDIFLIPQYFYGLEVKSESSKSVSVNKAVFWTQAAIMKEVLKVLAQVL